MTTKERSSFSAWQEENQVRRESIVSQYLDFLGKTRVKVRHPTHLAELVAKHISQVEGKPCNKSTLLRNVRYKAKLLSYQARSVSGVKSLVSRSDSDVTANALVTNAELECGNLRRELERLKIYTSTLEEQLDHLQGQGQILPKAMLADETASQLSEGEFRFIRTCQALRSLLSHLNLIVQVDPDNRRILDMSKRRNNVIVDEEVAGPFCDWLKTQGGKTI